MSEKEIRGINKGLDDIKVGNIYFFDGYFYVIKVTYVGEDYVVGNSITGCEEVSLRINSYTKSVELFLKNEEKS